MELTIGEITRESLEELITLHEQRSSQSSWLDIQALELTQPEQEQVELIQSRLIDEPTHLMNEATIWARGIYPLLMLAERDELRAWAEVPLRAQYNKFSVSGIADGVLGYGAAGRATTPYLVVLEAKKGIGAEDPIPQLYGEVLAAAHMNWRLNAQDPQSIYACYTVADSWTFAHATIAEVTSDRPDLKVDFSREFIQKLEAASILQILKRVVQECSKTV